MFTVTSQMYYGLAEETVGYIYNAFAPPENGLSQYYLNFQSTARPYLKMQFAFANENGSNLFSKGTTQDISFGGISIFAKDIERKLNFIFTSTYLGTFQYRFQYADNTYSTYKTIDKGNLSIKQIAYGDGMRYDFSLSSRITADKDVKRVFVIMYFNSFDSLYSGIDYYLNYNTIVGTDFKAEIKEVDEKVGLIGNIIEWVKSIFNSIVSGFESVSTGFINMIQEVGIGFSNMLNSLTQLPSKLWDVLSSGLKSLFMPDPNTFTEFKNKIDTLLSQKMGAVYQVGDIVVSSWESISSSDKTNIITMPAVTINLSGTPFTFGGYDVKIVPDGFSVVVEILKKILSILCTFAFVNGLLKRYDEVMGVES